MSKKNKKTKEPLLHIVKRDGVPKQKAWLIRILAVLAALIFAGIVTMLLTGENPIQVYITMFKGCFSSERRIWSLLQSLVMLLCVSLAVTPAFKMRFWNIGAEGQVLIGALATTACMVLLKVEQSKIEK
jgi:simple sugar transport system permease protein